MVKVTSVWCMPNAETFRMKPIAALLEEEIAVGTTWIDPFCRNSAFKDRMALTNDLSGEFEATHHMDAAAFLASVPQTSSCDGVLFDPPYSAHQIVSMYQGVSGDITKRKFAAVCYDHIARSLKIGGTCISFGWNSNGAGAKRGFVKERVLLLSHGGSHNDTIVTVERKIK